MRQLVLASTSPFRRTLLERLGLPFEAAAPVCDEVPPPGLGPRSSALRFAEEKARSLLPKHPGSLLIGADQVLELDGAIVRKAETAEDARAELALLSGKTHALHSAIAILDADDGRLECDHATTFLKMRALDRDAIERYVRHEAPIGSAGGYLYERRGVALFEEISGSDDSAIIGLPLVVLCRLLRRFGVDPLEGR